MALQQVTIAPEGQQSFTVLFNPTEYTIEKANQIAEVGVPGLSAPILQYVHGNTRTLSLELYFDTYEERTDVREYTNSVYSLLAIEPSTHVPPICNISWGTFAFRGVLDHASGKFTLFLSDGTPVRATLSVVFKEFIDVNVVVRENLTESSDHRKLRVIKAGDRLDTIAYEEYGNSAKWRPIAEANNLNQVRYLEPGRSLAIPELK
jgi:nucleoid-associated protein YgaU